MERLRRQSSQAAIIDRSSEDKMNSNGRSRTRRGNHQILKQKFQKSESDSSSRASCRTTLEQRLAFESSRSSSVLPAANLVKVSVADEMYEELESKTRSPSVVEKLMGLDRIPSQHGGNKQLKSASDRVNRKTVSARTCGHRQSCNNQSCRKIAKEQLIKDIYEVRESLEGQTERYKENEMEFIRQKFMDAKRLSVDEKLQGSKKFHDTIDVLNANNHLLMKFLQEPDLLNAKHLHDLHVSPLSGPSHCGKVRNRKVPSVLDHNVNRIGRHTGRGASQKIDISLSRDSRMGMHGHLSHEHTQASNKSIDLCSKGKKATDAAPAKIVLLKPNLGRPHKTGKSFSSSSSSHELPSDAHMRKKKQIDTTHGHSELSGKKRLPVNLDFSVYKSQECKELAREITQQMKRKLGEVSFNVPLSRYRRYSADDSCDDSSYESGTTFLAPQTRHRSSYQGRSSSSHYAESSVNKEGKKRLSERWKMTPSSMEIRMDKGTTLGEMLSVPDIDIEMAENGSSDRSDNVRVAGSFKPLGISSKDGCRGLLQFTSTYDHIDELEGLHGRKKATNKDLRWIEGSSSGNRRLLDKNRRSSHHMSDEMVNNDQDKQVGGSGKKSVVEEESPELKTVILESPTCLLDTTLNLDSIMDVEHENFPAAELSNEVQVKDHFHGNRLHESSPQDSVAQPESPVSSKEVADQPSPVSVLETPFSKNLLLGSELHGPRMQLQLLKLKSKTSSDDNETSFGFGIEDSSSYTADVLAELGFEDTDLNVLMTTWNSSQYPVGPWVFEKLEKKYNGQDMDSSRPNRKLLFDRIKCGISEIAHGSISPHPWLKSRHGIGTGIQMRKAWFENELRKLLADQEKPQEGIEEELQWMKLGTYVDGIGRELGKMVLDELIFESLVM